MAVYHRPTEATPDREWLIEGPMLDAGAVARTRLRVDAASGTLLETGDLPGQPHVELDDDDLILPGFIDVHVHCRDDPQGTERYKEDFASASLAALHGGVVCVGDMPNNPEPPVDRESYEAKRQLAVEKAAVDVMVYGRVTSGESFGADLPYKCYFGPSVGSRAGESPGAFSMASYRGCFVAFHAESPEILEERAEASTHEERRPPEAEARAIAEIAEIAREVGFHPHISHLSTAIGLDEVRRARASGLSMTCEVAPHHLFFDDENRHQFPRGAWLQMNPPLRSPHDRAVLKEALLSGEIELLATDHAPHSLDENARGISGVPLLDTFGAFMTWLVDEGFPWDVVVERASRSPARLYRPFIDGELGALVAGHPASFSVIGTRSPWTVTSKDLCTRARWSPFEGVTFPGSVRMTVVRGKLFEMK